MHHLSVGNETITQNIFLHACFQSIYLRKSKILGTGCWGCGGAAEGGFLDLAVVVLGSAVLGLRTLALLPARLSRTQAQPCSILSP